ncbi:protein regulator of cytokinesis 1-like isoform X3 [Carcharodon carcharias]|uniref:protein regulator of cytokinesis 1-like isoform X3 n=2 Tax=Carcharodon carcharias TaxID=13397 RepID=UPI001B7DD2A1|nr:protein regulator of cytokinesis 1-like isoform X3 [Carcharodon carcharias]
MARKSEVLASSIGHLLAMKMAKLQNIWDDVGIQEDKRLQRMASAKTCIEELLDQMIHEEELMKKQLEEAIKNWKGKLQTLCCELLLDPYKADSSTPLQLEKELRNKVEALLEEKHDRMAECEMLLKEDQALCTDLCKTPYYIPTGKVPSLQELEELKSHLLSAAEEKERRLATFLGLRKDITKLMADIDHVPDTTFEKDAVLEEENLFFLSDENIKSLEVLRHQLEVKKQELMATQESLRKQISYLWNTLQIPLEQQNMCATGSIYQVNTVLQQELEQLQQMQTKNIKQIITRIRQELNTYWDKCFYSQKQREFAFLLDENFTEELLKVHDEELVKITLYYQKHQELLVNVEKWECWWKVLLELEKKASDPNRYANRGGTLLKEEKERCQLQKKIPKLEEELKLYIERWETEQGCPFLVYGQKFTTCIANQWEQCRVKKVQEKQERCVKKEDRIGYKTPLKRALGASSTPQSKIRRLNGSSNFSLVNSGGSTCKRARKPSLAAQKTTNVSKLPELQKTPLQNKEMNAPSVSIVNQQPNTFKCLAASYSEFSRDFTRKSNHVSEQLNSTTLENP